MYCFVNEVTDKSASLDKSRELNADCVFLFYDLHDIWHLISAVCLSCMILINLHFDDDLSSQITTNINFTWSSTQDEPKLVDATRQLRAASAATATKSVDDESFNY